MYIYGKHCGSVPSTHLESRTEVFRVKSGGKEEANRGNSSIMNHLSHEASEIQEALGDRFQYGVPTQFVMRISWVLPSCSPLDKCTVDGQILHSNRVDAMGIDGPHHRRSRPCPPV